MAASPRRWTRRSSTRTISCKPPRSTPRRRPRPAERESRAMNPGGDDLLIRLDQKASSEHAAVVVVDVQNDFVADQGFFGKIGADVRTIQRCIPNLQRLLDGARAAGVLVIFIQA